MEGIEFVHKVNELLLELPSLDAVAEKLKIGRTTIRKRCKKAGYIYDKEVRQYILKEEYYKKYTYSNTEDIKKKSKGVQKVYTYSNASNITKISEEVPGTYNYSSSEDINNAMAVQKYFKNVTEEDLIKFKKVIDNIDKLVDIVDKKILILDIPYEEGPYQTTLKVNKSVYEQFKEKCKKDYPNYNIKDLLTHALQDFIERY